MSGGTKSPLAPLEGSPVDDSGNNHNIDIAAARLDHMEGENVSTVQHKRLELKIRELESKLELEKTTKTRMETQIQRQKELVDKMTREMDELRLREGSSQDEVKKMSRQLR